MGMKHYKLLKDTPTIKAGTIFEEVTSDYDELKELVRITPIGTKTSPQFTIQDIDNFDEWFEKIKADGIHWKPKVGEKYFYINEYGDIECETWDDDDVDNRLMAMGLIRRTEEKCEEARDRRLAEVRLRRTSDFKPDFENGEGGWTVFFSYMHKELHPIRESYSDSGEPVRYATEEEAKKSIKENREDWLTYFGVKE